MQSRRVHVRDARAILAHHQPIAIVISWTHSGQDEGQATLGGRHGAMKSEG